VNRNQLILVAGAIALLFGLYFFGRTTPHPAPAGAHSADDGHNHEGASTEGFNFDNYLKLAKENISPAQSARLTSLEESVVRGDLVNQKIQVYSQLVTFWRDSVAVFEPYAWYTGQKAKLENSEKSLTFAAHLYLTQCRGTADNALRTWMAIQAKDLFQRAEKLNPKNDSTLVGLAATTLFGADGNQPPMAAIAKIREVITRDSTNAYAWFMLGYGGVLSGQYDKAIERLGKVVELTPNNLEAIFLLAESYERSGDKANAAKWYRVGSRFITNEQVKKEVESRIQELEKK
jgi:tetratricopeptide (TPR) repeat protein